MQDTTNPTETPSATLLPGRVVGDRFRLEAKIGRGGFGEVWRASELLPDGAVVREVALKLLISEHVGPDWAEEAKILASIRHNALVTIYSAGILDLAVPTPFVAMELLDGEPFSDVLRRRRTIPWRRAIAWVAEIAAALDAIHSSSVVHLDLKPGNLFLGTDGHIRVLDFGIARSLRTTPTWQNETTRNEAQKSNQRADPPPSDQGALATGALLDLQENATAPSVPSAPRQVVVGTPGFVAPEILEGRPASPSADVYALGSCLFVMLTGVLPQRVKSTPTASAPAAELAAWRAEIRSSTVAGNLVSVTDHLPQIPRAIVSLLDRLLALDPAKRPTPRSLAALLHEVCTRPYGLGDSPYLGLSAYGPEAEGLLFGRDNEAVSLAKELETRSALVLQGASGSGKSSLAVAGIVPALARAFVDLRDNWVSAVVRPGDDLDDAVRKARNNDPNVGVVLVIDQLEELVTRLGPEAQARFLLAFERYMRPAAREPGFRVLCTLREDFTTRVWSIPAMAEALRDGIRFVPPPSPASARDIVLTPARLAGVSIDDEGPVVDDVLRELRAGEGRLPLVSFALAEWWKTRSGANLSVSTWRRLGGVAGALSSHADATLSRALARFEPAPASVRDGQTRPRAPNVAARETARELFLRLVTPDGTRARVSRYELDETGPSAASILDDFVSARLVVLERDEATFTHESLIVAWSTLAAWVSAEQADRLEAANIEAIAKVWRNESTARNELLLRDAKLARALDLATRAPRLAAPMADFITASKSAARRAAVWKNVLGFFVVLALISTALGYAEVTRQHEADLKKREKNLIDLKHQAEALQGESQSREAHLTAALASAQSSARSEIAACKNNINRIEQNHRAELASKFPADTFEHKVASFVQHWEHVWNLHDAERLASFFADDVTWDDYQGNREGWVQKTEQLWQKSPASRVLVSEIAVTKEGHGQTKVRLTREERLYGLSSIAVIQWTITGNGPGDFKITSASVERTVSNPKPLGCGK